MTGPSRGSRRRRTTDWLVFYDRGICYERSHQWAKAEADFHHALALAPDQPFVLNYLGYSWADMGQNLTQARQMIEKAAQQRPNDGAIVDSLGWVMLRQGETAEAVKTLERAVELEPEDASINGHLGRCLLGGRAQAGGDLSVAPRADLQSRARRCREAGGEAAERRLRQSAVVSGQ